jgi:8-oxo-dGTP pyrophosphatase MutT (NUDIX family)
LQLRDDKPGLPLRDHWVLFGGQIEEGEAPEAALHRELSEELEHETHECRWYTESVFVLPRAERRIVRRHYFTVPVTLDGITRMRQQEGADMRLFSVAEILSLERVSPWDLGVILMHARGPRLFAL